MKQLIIDLDDNEPEITLQEVLRLVKEGYLSGIEPSWEIMGGDEE